MTTKYDCSTCERDPEFKRIWGCDGDTADFPFEIEYAGKTETVRRCPLALLRHAEINDFLDAYHWAEKGVMPVEGGSEAQAASFLAACAFTRQTIAREDERMRDKEKRLLRHGNGQEA